MSFPSNAQYVPLTLQGTPASDPAMDESPEEVDIVGSAAYPAAYYAYDGVNVYFRLRLSNDPRFKTSFLNYAWGVLIDTDGNPRTYEWALVVNGLDTTLDLIRNSVQTPDSLKDPPEGTDGKGKPDLSTEICSFDIARAQATGDGSSFGGHANFFLDWLVPASVLFGRLGIDAQSVLRFAFFTATDNNNFNKDFLGGSPGTLSSAFADPATIAGGDIRAKLAVSQTLSPVSVIGGAQTTFQGTVTVKNTGRSDASSVLATASFQFDKPIGFTVVGTSQGSAFYNVAAQRLSWTVGALGAGAEAALSYTAVGLFADAGIRTIDTLSATGIGLATGASIASSSITATVDVVALGGIAGTVLSQATGLPLSGVTVQALSGSAVAAQTTTDTAGVYSFPQLAPASYTLRFTLANYDPATVVQAVAAGAVATANVTLTAIPASVRGTVAAAIGAVPIPGASIVITNAMGAVAARTTTDAAGTYAVSGLAPGNCRISFSAPGFQLYDQALQLVPAETRTLNASLAGAPGTVAGAVTSFSGSPLAGALVEVLDNRSNVLAAATTDASGLYSISNLPPDRNDRLRVSDTGYVTAIVGLQVTAGQTVTADIALSPLAGSVAGTVIDQTTGAPIPGATARVVSSDGLALQSAMTDANGAYEVPSLAPGSYSVLFGAPGYAMRTIGAIVASGAATPIDASLAQLAGGIAGTVADEKGTPLPGSSVRLFLNNAIVATASAGEDGSYRLDNLAPGKYLVSVRRDGFSGGALSVVVVPGETTGANFRLVAEPGSISGTVADAQGNPIAGALISVQLNLDGGSIVFLRFLTDTAGAYAADNLIAVPSILTVTAGGFQTSYASATILPGIAAVLDFVLQPDPGALQGRVADADGNPIAGAAVQLHAGNANGVAVASMFSDPTGAFLFGNLAPGVYTAVVSAAGFRTATAVSQVASDAVSSLDIPLSPDPGSIQGNVFDAASGQPLPGTILNAKTKNGLQIASTLVDDGGQYAIRGLPPGSYTLVANSLAHQSQTLGAIVRADAATTVDFAMLPSPGTLAVRTEPAIAGAAVNLLNGSNIRIASATTDQAGSAEFLTLAPDVYYLVATAPGYSSKATGTTVLADQTVNAVVPLVPLPGQISGAVLDTSGRPIAGAVVKALNGNESVRGVVQTGADGSYVVDGLPSGLIRLVASAEGFGAAVTSVSVDPGQSVAGVDIRLEPDAGSIGGQIADAVTGAPIAGAGVEVRFGSGTGLTAGSGASDPSGTYRFDGLPPGSYVVLASAASYASGQVGAVVVSDRSALASIALTPSFGRVEGAVTDRAGRPVPGESIEIRLYGQEGTLLVTQFANPDGTFVLDRLAPGEYVLNVSAAGYVTSTQGVFVSAGGTTTLRTALEPQAASIAGTVRNAATGTGIGGAQVNVNDVYGTPVGATFADENGRFALPGMPLGSYTVAASADRFGSATAGVVTSAGKTSQVALDLTPAPGSVFGFVSNLENGDNVAGAAIRFISGATGATVAVVLSGEGGQFAYEGLAPGEYTAACGAPGFAAELGGFAIQSSLATKFSFALAPLPGRLSGAVLRTGSDDPIPGSSVVVRQFNNFGPVVSQVVTDDDGRYDLGRIAAANYALSAMQSGFVSEQTSVRVLPDQLSTVDFRLATAPSSIGGTVTDPAGTPLPDSQVAVVDGDGVVVGNGVTDEGGAYAVPGAAGGEQTIVAMAPGRQTGTAFVPPTSQTGVTANVVLAGAPLSVRGSVTDNVLGGPVPGAIVSVLDPATNVVLATAVTDATGSYVVSGLRPGTFTVTASEPEFGSAGRTATAGGDGSLSLPAAFGTLTGTIRDGSGRPLYKALAEIVAPSGELVRQIISDRLGRYTLTNLAAGTQLARFSYPGKQTRTYRPVILDRQTTVLDVVLADEDEE